MTEKLLVNAPICVLAVDPGKSGAVCRIGKGLFEVRRDFKDFQDIAFAIADLARGCEAGVIENVHAMPGQGVVSMFTFGKAAGAALGAILLSLSRGTPIVEVSPQKWQNFFRKELGIARGELFHSPTVATRIFPSYAPTYLKRKLDHNSADAILMAAWYLLHPIVPSASSSVQPPARK